LLAARIKAQLKGFSAFISGPEMLPSNIPAQYVEQTMASSKGLLRQWRIFELTPGMKAHLINDSNPLNQSSV